MPPVPGASPSAPSSRRSIPYNFVVDGVRILDPGNPNLKNGRALDASIVEVPGNPPRFDAVQSVPHGALQIRTYLSTPLKKPRKLYVYTPPQYDAEPNRRFPVLYLRHGSGDNEENWSDTGRAGVILDNLIAQHKAVPMLIVMPNGDTDGSWAGGSSPEGIEMLSQELLSDIIPMIDGTYRVAPRPREPRHRRPFHGRRASLHHRARDTWTCSRGWESSARDSSATRSSVWRSTCPASWITPTT